MTSKRSDVVCSSRLEFGILILTLFALSGGLSAFLPDGQTDALPEMEKVSEAGDAYKQLMFSVLYVANLALLVRLTRPWTWSFIGLPLLGLVLLCFASVAWSAIPDGTARRAVAASGPVIVGLYAGLRFDERRLTAAICTTAALALVGSAIWAVAFRSLAFDENGYFRGLFFHKDAFGAFLGLSVVTTVYRLLVLRDYRIYVCLLLAGLTACATLAGSSTTIVTISAAASVLAIALLLYGSEGLLLSVVPLFIGGIAVVAMLAATSDFGLAEVLGRDSSLSGRIPIWQFVIPKIGERPWLGYGFGIFWLGVNAPAASFEYLTGEHVAHTHNGYLQLLVDVGAVGLTLFGFSFLQLVRRTAKVCRLGKMPLTLWIVPFLTYFLVNNIVTTDLWEPNDLFTTLYVWAVVHVSREAWRLRFLAAVSSSTTRLSVALKNLPTKS